MMASVIIILSLLLVPVIVEGLSPQCSRSCDSQFNSSLIFKEFCCIFNNLGKTHKVFRSGELVLVVCPSTIPDTCQPASCHDILLDEPTSPSGYYNITLSDTVVTVYCDMEGTNCDEEGGWMRIANVNVSQDGANCPEGLGFVRYVGVSYDLCDSSSDDEGCYSTTFSTYGVTYSSVCGRVRGYQYGTPDGIDNAYINNSIDSIYVDGVSITHGSPRKHIWTFMAGGGESNTQLTGCPCNTGSVVTVPPFIGDDYYCESGGDPASFIYTDDPLWDGQQCNNLESPCCTNPNLPYFVKTLNVSTIDDVELRLCNSEGYPNEATPLDIIELYVK